MRQSLEMPRYYSPCNSRTAGQPYYLMETAYTRLGEHYTYQDSMNKRSTDLPWLLLFAASVVVYVLIYLAELGDAGLDRLHPFDSAGGMCGEGERASYPYLYYLEEAETRYSVCVQHCPEQEFACFPNHWVPACDYTYQQDNDSPATATPYESGLLLETVCFPGDSDDPPEDIWELIGMATARSLLGVLPLALCCLYFLLLRHLVTAVLWLFFAAGSLLLCYVGYEMLAADVTLSGYPVGQYLGALLLLVAGSCLLLAFWLRERLYLAGVVARLAVAFLFSQLSSLLLGLMAYAVLLTTIVLGLGLAYMTYARGSLAEPGPSAFPVLLLSGPQRSLLVYEILVFAWCFLFWQLFFRMILANAVIKWYFRKHAVLPVAQVLPSAYTTLRYHLGQLAFASLLQALTVPVFLALIQLRGLTDSLTDVCDLLKGLFFVLSLGLLVLGRFTLANLAYTDNSLCESLRSTYMLLVKNPLRTVMYESARLLVGLMAFAGLGLSCSYLSAVLLDQPVDSSFSGLYTGLLYLSTIGIVVEVFGAVADAVLMCVLQDLEDQDKGHKIKGEERQDAASTLFPQDLA